MRLSPATVVAVRSILIATIALSVLLAEACASIDKTQKGIVSMKQATHVYKQVGGMDIKAEIFFDAASTAPRPVVVGIHGGALMGGSRPPKPDHLGELLLEAGYALVYIDYRLAPETKLPEILADVRDAHNWVREKGPELFGADPKRLATMGGSAGGYLTLAAGYIVNPRPRALVSFYGYGDIAGEWYSKPDKFYLKQVAPISEEQAWSVVENYPLTAPPQGKEMTRLKFYYYCRQQGLWPKEVTGFDPHTQDAEFDPFCPVRNVTKDYPPTILLHGQKDTDVPWEQSQQMADALKKAGVVHELALYPEGFHGFDAFWKAEQVRPYGEEAINRAFRFIQKHTR